LRSIVRPKKYGERRETKGKVEEKKGRNTG